MKREKQQEEKNNKEKPSFTLICFLCGKNGHIRPNCHKNQKKNQNQKIGKKLKKKKCTFPNLGPCACRYCQGGEVY